MQFFLFVYLQNVILSFVYVAANSWQNTACAPKPTQNQHRIFSKSSPITMTEPLSHITSIQKCLKLWNWHLDQSSFYRSSFLSLLLNLWLISVSGKDCSACLFSRRIEHPQGLSHAHSLTAAAGRHNWLQFSRALRGQVINKGALSLLWAYQPMDWAHSTQLNQSTDKVWGWTRESAWYSLHTWHTLNYAC